MQPLLQCMNEARCVPSVGDLRNHVADIERVGQKARDNFDIQGIVSREVIAVFVGQCYRSRRL